MRFAKIFQADLEKCIGIAADVIQPHAVQQFNEPRNQTVMPHVVTDKCNKCKFTDCVEVCPVACFYEVDNQVFIHPEDCIDCQACVPECPVEAIYEESDVPPEFQANVEFNSVEARRLKDSGKEAIVKKREPLPTAAARKAELGY